MALLLGSEVKFSFTTFFAMQPMPATNPVRTAASVIVSTSLNIIEKEKQKVQKEN